MSNSLRLLLDEISIALGVDPINAVNAATGCVESLKQARARLAEVEEERDSYRLRWKMADDSRMESRAILAEVERERDAYRKAKQENDERFMNERDTARAERDAARAEVRVMTDFIHRAAFGGSIVSTDKLSSVEIAVARANDRMLVIEGGFGFVHLSDGLAAERDTARAERDVARAERDAAVTKANQWQWEAERIGNNYRRELLRADGLIRELDYAQKAYVSRITNMAKFDDQNESEANKLRADVERMTGGNGHLTHRIETLEAESAKLRCTLIEAAEQCDEARMGKMAAMLRKAAHGE